jgi:OOP family OmpA-OmpF porin
MSPTLRHPLRFRPAVILVALALPVAAPAAHAPAGAPGDQAVVPPAKPLVDDKARNRTVSMPAQGLFQGDGLSERAKSRLVDVIVQAAGLDVEVALLIPTGPWQIDGSGAGERDLTPARLQSIRKFLTERGIDPKRIFVESRIDAKLTEPRLDVQLVGRPANE